MFWAKLILVELGPYISIALLNTALVIFLNISHRIQLQFFHCTGSNYSEILQSPPQEC